VADDQGFEGFLAGVGGHDGDVLCGIVFARSFAKSCFTAPASKGVKH